VRNDVLILLGSFDGKESSLYEAIFFLDSLASFFRGELTIYAHETGTAPNVFVLSSEPVVKSSQKVHNTFFIGLCSHI